MRAKRKICFVTGSRAEYGLMYWLMKEVVADNNLQFQLIVTGSHLSAGFGSTAEAIEKDGFSIDYKVHMLLSGDSEVAVTKSMGLGVIGFSDAYDALKPDIVVVLGDRYEIFAAVQAALIFRIPVAHLHGGESCESLIDDPIRHAITKMSHLHFTAADEYAHRVAQMGENPNRVFNLGGPGLDHLFRTNLLEKSQLEKELGCDLSKRTYLITYHPVTLRNNEVSKHYQSLFEALESLSNCTLIFTYSNADTHGGAIPSLVENYKKVSKNHVCCFKSLGSCRYLSLAKLCQAVIGNSSSGLIEIPFLKVPTVNIGERQLGRLRANTVIDCNNDSKSICDAIEYASSAEMTSLCQNPITAYKWDDTSSKIKGVLSEVSLDDILVKRFYSVSQKEPICE